MALLSEFENLHIKTKSIVLTISSTIPFFFIAVYLFKPTLIQLIEGNPFVNIHFYFWLSLIVALSIVWFFMNFMLGTIATQVFEKRKKKERQQSGDDFKQLLQQNTGEELSESIIAHFEKNRETRNKRLENRMKTEFGITYVYSTGYLSVAIFLNQVWLHWSFEMFLVGCISFILFRLIALALRKYNLDNPLENPPD